jgi:hypothetical protein
MNARQRASIGLMALIAAMLLVGGCSPRPIMVPMCEGVLYVWQANQLSAGAIDALVAGDLGERDKQLERAQLSLKEAEARLSEANGSRTEGWDPILAGFADAIGQAGAVIDEVAVSSPADIGHLRGEVSEASASLTTLGPPSGCIPKGSSSPSAVHVVQALARPADW